MATTVTSLNPTQKHIIKMFSYAKDKEQLDDLKNALAAYFASNIDKAMDKLWAEGKWDNQKNEEILKEHLRTPYEK